MPAVRRRCAGMVAADEQAGQAAGAPRGLTACAAGEAWTRAWAWAVVRTPGERVGADRRRGATDSNQPLECRHGPRARTRRCEAACCWASSASAPACCASMQCARGAAAARRASVLRSWQVLTTCRFPRQEATTATTRRQKPRGSSPCHAAASVGRAGAGELPKKADGMYRRADKRPAQRAGGTATRIVRWHHTRAGRAVAPRRRRISQKVRRMCSTQVHDALMHPST
jgi:hypothetical protein